MVAYDGFESGQEELEEIEYQRNPTMGDVETESDCPICGAPMDYYFEYEIENDSLYSASGGYDGVYQYEWFDCPGCGYSDN